MKKLNKRNAAYSVTGVIVLVLLLAPMALSSGAKSNAAPEKVLRTVKVVELRNAGEASTRIFPGEVRASDQADLSFRVAGTLQELPVISGQRVKTGDLIARLDSRDFVSGLEQAQSSLHGAEAKLAEMKKGARREDVSALQAQVNAASAQYKEAKLSLDRYTNLLNSGAVSRSEYDKVKAANDVARESLRVAEQNLAKGRAGSRAEEVKAQEAVINGLQSSVKTAADALRDTELRAPFDGVVAEKYVDNFQAVQKNQSIVALQNMQTLDVVVSVPGTLLLNLQMPSHQGGVEEQAKAIAVESNVLARFPSIPERTFPLKFKEVATKGNVQSQTYDTTFVMERPDDVLILPGMGLDVLATITNDAKEKGAFKIPVSALIPGDDNSFSVWRLHEGQAGLSLQKMPVAIIGYAGNDCLISGDLTAGLKIVTAGVGFLHEGDMVQLYVSPSIPAESSN